jgi:Rps23 Pro-64 3,4-dihydroxylase Tpa1-like proline 4-hydroxylase
MMKKKITLQIIRSIKSSKKTARYQWLNPEGTKTRYFVIDNLIDKDICQMIFTAFPKDGKDFQSIKSFKERKKTTSNLNAQKKILSDITYAFQNKRIIKLISNITGFQKIVADSDLYAGGLSIMFKGDFLNPHIDHSHDKHRKMYRRLNILYYVSPDWKIENGGNLELWNENLTSPKTITALTNRLVVMETNKSSWHSVSHVQTDNIRCCISIYFYSKISPDFTEYSHVTSFTGRPQEKIKKWLATADKVFRGSIFKASMYLRNISSTKKLKKRN